MVNQEVLRDYSSSIKNLKREAANAGISEEDFKKLYFESLKTLEKSERPSSLTIVRNNKLKIISVLLLVFALFNFKYVYSSFVCNLQEYIYPGLRLLRKISIPFISLFPALSGILVLYKHQFYCDSRPVLIYTYITFFQNTTMKLV